MDGERQKAHYEAIHDAYEAHYFDEQSCAYRDRFILAPILAGLDLNGKDVLDLASGSGHNTLLLQRRFPGLRAMGLDISDTACTAYRTTTGFLAMQGDLTRPVSLPRQFDVAVVIGGLHHCVADLSRALDNVAAALRPGGVFLMMEPSSDSFLERARSVWYRSDRYFDAPTEHALSHDELLRMAAGRFRSEVVQYIGGPAYFAILNSLVLRVPLAAKRWLSPGLFPLEAAFNSLNARKLGAAFIARWRKA